MGLILDIVPNHMGVGGDDNAWWLDVLEWGRASPYAEYFDIDWDPPDPTLRGRMLAPFLGASYGECLQNGELVLQVRRERRAAVRLAYDDAPLPDRRRATTPPCCCDGGPLETPARAFAELGPGGRARRCGARAEEAREELLQPGLRAPRSREALRAYRAGTPEGRERLHRLLERQNYRLAWWRAAADEINWRRFFDVNGLAGVRAEVPEVFEATHRTVFRLYAEGADRRRAHRPCRRPRRPARLLPQAAPPAGDAAAAAPAGACATDRAIIWIEKILAPHERLAADWLTDGTTGYDFMNDVAAVLHDPAGEAPLTELWTTLTGRPGEFEVEAQAARRQILRESLSSELFVTAAALHRIARRDLRHARLHADRDPPHARRAAGAFPHLPHLRRRRPASRSRTQRQMDWAMAGARRTVRTADLPLLELVGEWLSGNGLRDVPAGTRAAGMAARDGADSSSSQRADRREIGRGHRVLPLRPPALAQRGRLASRRSSRITPGRVPRRQPGAPAPLAAAPCSPPRRTTTSAARTPASRLAVLSEMPDEWESRARSAGPG